MSMGIGGVSDGAPPKVFNREIKRVQRDACALRVDREHFAQLRGEVAERLIDRLDDTTRTFPEALELGCADGQVLARLPGHGGVQSLLQVDSSQRMLDLCQEGSVGGIEASKVLVDEEEYPFGKESLDLVISNLALHWINDVPGTLTRIRESLRPDSLFLASILGGDTLVELRHAFAVAEMERDGGISPHVSPLAGVADAGNLLGRAGFALQAVDTDTLTLRFPSAMDVMHVLGAMGENNAVDVRRPFVSKDTVLAAAAVYETLYGDEDGVPATFQVIYLSGWSPHGSQQQPKQRGSAKVSLSEIGEVHVLGDNPARGGAEDGPPRPPAMDTSRE